MSLRIAKIKLKKKNRLKSFTRDKTSKHDVRISQPVLHVSWLLLRLIYMLSNSLQCETLEMVILATAERTFVMFTGDLVFLRQDVLTFNLLVISSCSKYLEICIKSYNKKKFLCQKWNTFSIGNQRKSEIFNESHIQTG